jgi:hypothetical protein
MLCWHPVNGNPELWRALRARGMRTAFRFQLLAQMTTEQRDGLTASLIHLPVTSLVFLKHFGRVEVDIQNSAFPTNRHGPLGVTA